MAERKIGEIFEYNGEWYQCVVAIDGCRECSFRAQDYCTRHSECLSAVRSDKTSVIFKKLEKVGQPYTTYVDKTVQNYLLETAVSVPPKVGFTLINNEQRLIAIEIKQNKENMEEYKMYDAKEDIPEFDKVVDECLFGENKPNLKPFDLEAAKLGKPVCTRDGRKARIICFDMNSFNNHIIVALITEENGTESIYSYTGEGKWKETETENDLMMLLEKKKGWINIPKNAGFFKSREEAERNCTNEYFVAKVEWEE